MCVCRAKKAEADAEREAEALEKEAREEARRQRLEEARRDDMARKKALLAEYHAEREREAQEMRER